MKRFITMTLLAAMLLASCGGEAPADTTAEAGTTTEAPEETTAEPFDVPEALDFGGRKFNVLACDESVPYTYFEDVEQESGEVMNDAIFRRNQMVEEYLNVDIRVENVDGMDTVTRLQKDVMSGDQFFDMVSPHIIEGVASMVTEDYVADLSTLEHVDFTKSWWNGSFVETMAIKGKSFFASGDMIVPNARVIVFNKKMMTDYKLPNIYDTIRAGKWTLDEMGKYTKGMVRDLNGNNTFDEDDQYAFSDLSNTGLATSFLHASGQLVVEREGDDDFRITLKDEKMHTLLNKLYDYLYLEGNTEITNTEFGEGNVLFGSQVLLKLQVLRNADIEFGVIPFPKFDEAQEDYYSSVWNGLVCVPITAKDKDCCGAVLETMAHFSSETLVPAYYEKLLGGKFTRDADSVEMLDIIFDSLVFDIGFCYDNFISCYASLGRLLNQGSTDLASYTAENLEAYEKHYRDLFDSVE